MLGISQERGDRIADEIEYVLPTEASALAPRASATAETTVRQLEAPTLFCRTQCTVADD